MKLPKTIPDKNVLLDILNLFPEDWEDLTISTLDLVSAYLDLSGIHCDSHEETFECVNILHKMGLIKLEETVIDKEQVSYRVKNNYGY
jgi:hypothetical protein